LLLQVQVAAIVLHGEAWCQRIERLHHTVFLFLFLFLLMAADVD
jgi:hypothetical protein